MRTFLASDTHFGHENIIRFCNRPFKSLEKMDNVLIKNWNMRVKPDDFVVFTGDFAFRQAKHIGHYLSQLNGNKTMICGNHDRNNGLNTKVNSILLATKFDKYFCVHDPRHVNRSYNVNFVGHVHEAWKVRKIKWSDTGKETFFVNVGVDVWNFRPVELQELVDFTNKQIKITDPEIWDYKEWIKPYVKRVSDNLHSKENIV